ncbi:molybdenum-dependent transcriptional regulator [Marinobacterium nitratireducens]|uniref:Molybdenum-dependent transcriptional regulator n=1 Tax=Marinobacterium nitratireducens TaxID=518897 RepID=A0A917Z8Y7_9GAMM|nr:TOBE domain-containing protein [Marinobacterium nitratireducens]GGO77316.1 molybdenum-dependent transcriptional regulator [Marinobacterium nitratireducens]
MELDILLTLQTAGRDFINPKRIRLLEQIREQGSISRGAKAAGVSYKFAWDAVADMNALAGRPLVSRETGGKGGGGARLTGYGERLLNIYRLLNQIEAMAVAAVQDERVSLDSLLSVVSRMGLQTSARNQLIGRVEQLNPNDISHKVSVRLENGDLIHADITERSARRLKLETGKEVLALVKAPWVQLACASEAPSEARDNRLYGTLVGIDQGAEFDEYRIALAGDEPLCALVSRIGPPATSFRIGEPLVARFAPDQVILATLE